MRPLPRLSLLAVGLCVAAQVPMRAHFKLIEPASWLMEDERGDPQKAGPCGGTNTDYGKPSYAVTKVRGGSTIHLKVQETIYHPGHYRVALAVNSPNELPLDPKATTETTDRGLRSVSAEIQSPAQPPVLADGLFDHHARVAVPFEADIALPNIDCRRCTLQVIQFMEEHAVNNPGMFTYHHCAVLEITPDPQIPVDQRWPTVRPGA